MYLDIYIIANIIFFCEIFSRTHAREARARVRDEFDTWFNMLLWYALTSLSEL